MTKLNADRANTVETLRLLPRLIGSELSLYTSLAALVAFFSLVVSLFSSPGSLWVILRLLLTL